jgi:hypothetical protein
MENQGWPNHPKFQKVKEVLWHPFKKLNDSIKFLWPPKRKRIQSQMLNQVKPGRDHSGQGVQLVPEVAFAANHIFSSHLTHASVPLAHYQPDPITVKPVKSWLSCHPS